MPTSARLFHRLLAVVLLLLLQGPALLVQEVAWAGMLVNYSRENGLARGVVETFDGSRPCPLCRAAEKLRKETTPEKDRPEPPRMTWGYLLPSALFGIVHPAPDTTRRAWRPAAIAMASGRRDAPPVPPPRRL